MSNESTTKLSALQKLLKEIEGKPANESDKKAAVKAFIASQGERAKLQKALDDFDKKADGTAVALVKCFGAQHVTLGGVRYVPTSRGDRVYYKKMGDTEAVSLD